MKNYTYVSLGSACQVAIQLKMNNIRRCAYCFDTMWNKHSGLINIIDILQDDFKKLSQRENYVRNKQFKITNKVYPDTGFPHNKLFTKRGWDTFIRRIERMKDMLKDKKKICFVYFRDIEILINNNYRQTYQHIDIELVKEQIRLFMEETIYFRETINILYPELKFHLKAFYRVDDKKYILIINQLLETFKEDKITYNIVIGKNKDIWSKSLNVDKYINQNPYI